MPVIEVTAPPPAPPAEVLNYASMTDAELKKLAKRQLGIQPTSREEAIELLEAVRG